MKFFVPFSGSLEASNVDIFVACPELSRRVCTPNRGVLQGPPLPLALHEDWRVVDFDEEVVGMRGESCL